MHQNPAQQQAMRRQLMCRMAEKLFLQNYTHDKSHPHFFPREFASKRLLKIIGHDYPYDVMANE